MHGCMTHAQQTTDHDTSSLAFGATIMGCTIMFKDVYTLISHFLRLSERNLETI